MNLYRFLTKVLINIQKHANADHVDIEIELGAKGIQICIKDNGEGFEVPERWTIWRETSILGRLVYKTAFNGRRKINHLHPGAAAQSLQVYLY